MPAFGDRSLAIPENPFRLKEVAWALHKVSSTDNLMLAKARNVIQPLLTLFGA